MRSGSADHPKNSLSVRGLVDNPAGAASPIDRAIPGPDPLYPILDKLISAKRAVLVAPASLDRMLPVVAMSLWDALVHDFTAVGATAHRRVIASVILFGARCSPHCHRNCLCPESGFIRSVGPPQPRRSFLGDAYPHLFFDEYDFAAGDQMAVGTDFDRFVEGSIQSDHGAATHLQKLTIVTDTLPRTAHTSMRAS